MLPSNIFSTVSTLPFQIHALITTKSGSCAQVVRQFSGQRSISKSCEELANRNHLFQGCAVLLHSCYIQSSREESSSIDLSQGCTALLSIRVPFFNSYIRYPATLILFEAILSYELLSCPIDAMLDSFLSLYLSLFVRSPPSSLLLRSSCETGAGNSGKRCLAILVLAKSPGSKAAGPLEHQCHF